MEDRSFENNEYNYYSVLMIFGSKSPKIREQFGRYCFESFRKLPFKFTENEKLNVENHLEIVRTLRIDKDRYFESSHTEMSSEINKIITYVDPMFKINVSDSTFNDDEFEYFKRNWDENVRSKIKNFSILLCSVHNRILSEIPIFVNEFPNIAKMLLEYPHFWTIGKDPDHAQDQI